MAASFNARLKSCTTPHAMSHFLFGIGLGFILVGLFSGLVENALMLGIIVGAVAMVWDFVVNKA